MRTGANVFLRADGRWEARYQKSRDENGTIHYGFVYGHTREEAEKKRMEAIAKLAPDAAHQSGSMLPSVNPAVQTMPVLPKKPGARSSEKIEEPLHRAQIDVVNRSLEESGDPAALGFFLGLHMGLTLGEITALRYGDIHHSTRTLHIRYETKMQDGKKYLTEGKRRELLLPVHVQRFMIRHGVLEKDPTHFVLTDDAQVLASNRAIGAAFRRLVKEPLGMDGVTANILRCTFIKTCFDVHMNVETVAMLSGMERELLYRYFGRFIQVEPDAILRTDLSGGADGGKRLNLLILGAGGHGQNVMEVAERLGIFHEIKFLDDLQTGENIIGRCEDSGQYTGLFPCAFVAIGNNDRRKYFTEKLRREGYLLPKIIHPDATISHNAVIGDGTVVLAQATIDAAAVGESCIIASNALINRGAVVGDGSHVDCGGIVLKETRVPPMTTVGSGEIFKPKA